LVVYVHGVFCFVYCCGRSMADFSNCVNFYFSRSEEKYSAACSACHSYMACVAAS
jgi:hypothetical protein